MDADPSVIYRPPARNLSDAEVLNAVITGYIYFNMMLSRTDLEPVTKTAQSTAEIDDIIARMEAGQIKRIWANVNGSRSNTRFAPCLVTDIQAIRAAFLARYGANTNDGNFKPFGP